MVMPTLRCSPEAELHYLVDDFTDPWLESETILLLHGNAESGAAWYGWIPSLARRYRVVRPDMRGFGASTPMPREFPWTLDIVIDDFVRLMDSLGIERFHLVAAKIGGTIARAFAARRRRCVRVLPSVHPNWPRNSNGRVWSIGRAGRWRAATAAPFLPKASSGG